MHSAAPRGQDEEAVRLPMEGVLKFVEAPCHERSLRQFSLTINEAEMSCR